MNKYQFLIVILDVAQLKNVLTGIPGGEQFGHQDKKHLSGKPLDFSSAL